MENIQQVNSIKLECLSPLGKWRIVDVQSLVELLDNEFSYWHLHKIIRRFEKANVIKSFKDPWTKRKVIYLEGLGNRLLGLEKSTSINSETLLHDSKVSQVMRNLLKRKVFKEVYLEHELSKKLFASGELAPDALIKGENNNVKFSMAFELELTRKAQERSVSKARNYINSELVDYVLYLFCSESLYESYKRLFNEELPKGWNNKLMLFANKSLMSAQFDVGKAKGCFKNKEVLFDEIF